MEPPIQAYRTDLVRRVTGLTQRQLVRLEQHGIAVPSVSGRSGGWPGLYSFQDLVRLRVAAEMLKRDFTAPEIRRFVDEYMEKGVADPLTTLRLLGDPPEPDDPETGRRWRGRVFVLSGEEARSGHHAEQPAELFDLKMQDLRVGLVGTLEHLLRRPTGETERVRGVQASQRVIKGTRIPTRLIAKLAEAGWSSERIIRSYPILVPEDIRAALRAERSRAVA